MKTWAKPLLRNVKSLLPVDVRHSKTPSLKFPNVIPHLQTSPSLRTADVFPEGEKPRPEIRLLLLDVGLNS